MDKCKCYQRQRYIKGWKDSSTPIFGEEVGVCLGTKEMEECLCNGNESECDFYNYIKEKARRKDSDNNNKKKVHEAIKFLTAIGYNVTKRSKQ